MLNAGLTTTEQCALVGQTTLEIPSKSAMNVRYTAKLNPQNELHVHFLFQLVAFSVDAAIPKHASTENAKILAPMRDVEPMLCAQLKPTSPNALVCLDMMVTHMFSASSLNAEPTLTVHTPWLVAMKSVLTPVTVLPMLTVMPGITEATAHAARASLVTPTLLAAIQVRAVSLMKRRVHSLAFVF